MCKREISTPVCVNLAPARYSQRMLGRRVEPITCGASIGVEVGGVYEYAADARGRMPREGAMDGWIWRNEPFSVRGMYQQLRTSQSEDPVVLDACRAVWKERLPHKVAVFAWTIARQRVLTQVRHRYLFSTGSALCMLCGEHAEDCEHLFFKYPFAIRIWASQGLSEIKSSSIFWATTEAKKRS